MPIFDYRCDACGHTFDVLQKLGAEPLKDCPECSEATLKKMLSAPAFHLKGKGWRNSDDTPKKTDVRPKFAHTLDSATPHAEHTHDGPAKPAKGKPHGHSHDKDHGHSHSSPDDGGMGKLVRDHVHGKSHGHSHGGSSGDSDAGKKGHSHGHSHKHDHD